MMFVMYQFIFFRIKFLFSFSPLLVFFTNNDISSEQHLLMFVCTLTKRHLKTKVPVLLNLVAPY